MTRIRTLGLLLSATLAVAACSHNSSDQTAALSAPATPPPNPTVPTLSGPARQKAPDGTTVSFVGIKAGDTVTSPFKVGFAVTGASIAPAGTLTPGSGHFHLIIDSALPPQDAPLPASANVKHYGKGQTEDTITLPPGQHTLQIELADGIHVPFDPPVVSDLITVTVK